MNPRKSGLTECEPREMSGSEAGLIPITSFYSQTAHPLQAAGMFAPFDVI